MKLSARLLISFGIIIIVPLILLSFVFGMTGMAMEDRVDVLISAFLILLFTAIILYFWLYLAVVPRLNEMTKAADRISEGDLSHEIESRGNDELTEVMKSLESMRERLKENAEEKLRTEEAERQLISNIAHDIKTPLTAIEGYAEGLLDGVANTEEKREAYIKTIHNKAGEMNALINELTVYSGIETDRIPYEFEHISARSFFDDCADEVGMDLSNRQIEFSYHNDIPEDVKFTADPTQLMRVIHNIIDNSMKYRGLLPLYIELSVMENGKNIRVELSDNGIGIDEKDLPHIFDRTFRADASRNTKAGGSGIGLSIAKKIITDHGGKIYATSSVGRGTTIYFEIKEDKWIYEQDTDH